MAQFLRPNNDIAQNNWTGQPGLTWGEGVFTRIDETTADDADYGISPTNPSTADYFEAALSSGTDPNDDTNHTWTVRYRKQGGKASNLDVGLYQGATNITEVLTFPNPGTSWNEHSYTAGTSKTVNITDYSDLRLRFTPSVSGGGSPTEVEVSYAVLSIPDAPTGTPYAVTADATAAVTADLAATADATASVTAPSVGVVAGAFDGSDLLKPHKPVWYHDGLWWAILEDDAAARKYLWRRDAEGSWSRVGTLDFGSNATNVDAYSDGTNVWVSRVSSSSAQVYRLDYDGGTQSYSIGLGAVTSDFNNTDQDAATRESAIVADTNGRVWVFTAANGNVYYTVHSATDLSVLQAQTTLASGLGSGVNVLASATAFNDGTPSIGVAWGNETAWETVFAHHHDADAITTWQANEVIDNRTSYADDHTDIAAGPDGSVYAVYKTGLSGEGDDNILLARRSPAGTWGTPVVLWSATTATSPGENSRPRVITDGAGDVHVVSVQYRGFFSGRIEYRKASADLATIDPSTVIIDASGERFLDPTLTRGSAPDAGLLVLAARNSDATVMETTLATSPGGTPYAATADATGTITADLVSTADATGTVTADLSATADATGTVTEDLTATADATGTVTADLAVTADATGTITADLSATADATGTITADLSASADATATVGATLSATADATGTVTADLSAAADATGTVTASLAQTADSAVRVSAPYSGSADAFLTVSAAHSTTADATAKVSADMAATADASVTIPAAFTATADGAATVTADLTATADAAANIETGLTATADATGTVTADHVATADATGAVTADFTASADATASVVDSPYAATADAAATVTADLTASADASAAVHEPLIASADATGTVTAAFTATADAAARIESGLTVTADATAAVHAAFTATADAGATVTADLSASADATARVETGLTVTADATATLTADYAASADAAARIGAPFSASTDATASVTADLAATADMRARVAAALGWTADATATVPQAVTFTADAGATITATFEASSDSTIRVGVLYSESSDSHVRVYAPLTARADAALTVIAPDAVFSTDATVRVRPPYRQALTRRDPAFTDRGSALARSGRPFTRRPRAFTRK